MIKILIANKAENTPRYQKAMEHLGFAYTCTDRIPEDADSYDALILPGGSDIDPAFFHQENMGSRGINRALDEVQLGLFHRFADTGRPVLGICKGCQVINVGLGGTLIQDLPDPLRSRHCYHADDSGEYHETEILPGTFLYDMYGGSIVTNSYHHQALGKLGEGLRCIQKSRDGVAEMIVHDTLPILGTQWHPEVNCWDTAKEGVADGAPLFRYFAAMVRRSVKAEPHDRPTLRSFLTHALQPCGHTLYVWGGGWNEADSGAGKDGLTLGENPAWHTYFDGHAGHYDYRQHRFEHGNGLDCSGFVGWALYQIFAREDGEEPGYVMSSTAMAQTFAARGFGRFVPREEITYYRPGDIVSLNGHVWISLGQYRDGSVMLIHSTPNGGVQVSGTVTREGHYSSMAMEAATGVMVRHFPEWSRHYSTKPCGPSYLTGNLMRWDLQNGPLCDPEGLTGLYPHELCRAILEASAPLS